LQIPSSISTTSVPRNVKRGSSAGEKREKVSTVVNTRTLLPVASWSWTKYCSPEEGLPERDLSDAAGSGPARFARRPSAMRARSLGGGRRSGRIEAQKKLIILALLKETAGCRDREATPEPGEKGVVSGEGTVRRFLIRHGITRKKDRDRRASTTDRTS
jgi:hypothetical protein